MKALTLHQPHAMLVETGWKEVETRSWYTNYRGPLAIHASLRWTEDLRDAAVEIVHKLRRRSEEIDPERDWREAVPDCLWQHGLKGKESLGCVVAICELAGCLPMGASIGVLETNCAMMEPEFVPKHGWEVERVMGNYDYGRFAWIPPQRPADRPLHRRKRESQAVELGAAFDAILRIPTHKIKKAG